MATGLYDYIRCGETSKEVGCSIGSSWVGTGAAFDEKVTLKFGGIQKSSFLLLLYSFSTALSTVT